MQALKTLPPHYEPHGTLDLSKNWLAVLGMNVVGVAFLCLFGWLAALFLPAVRTDVAWITLETIATLEAIGNLATIAALLALYALMIILHELAHGIFFWLFTRERPVFGLKFPHAAYAAAPDWYLPRNQHLVVGLAPFVLLTLAGAVLLPIVPAPVVPALLLIVVINGAGAAGDFMMVAWLLAQPRETLERDTGDTITIYRPT